jgi:hypothetical protein
MVPMGRPRYDPEAIAMNRIVEIMRPLSFEARMRVAKAVHLRYWKRPDTDSDPLGPFGEEPAGRTEPEFQFTCPHGLSLDVKCGQCTGTMTATPIYDGSPPGDAEP